jgi:ATP-dependent Clp protease ATP-binding subunit ClpA
MFERFTDAAVKCIMLAQEESKRLKHNFVGTEQILLGLISEGKGIAAKALRSAGVDLPNARKEVEKIIGRGADKISQEIPFTPRALNVLRLAWNEAKRLAHNHISTEHLLIGITLEEGGVAYRVLENLRVDIQVLRQSVWSMCGGPNTLDMPRSPMIPSETTRSWEVAPFFWYAKDAVGFLQKAWQSANMLGNGSIDSSHLFLALLTDEDTIRRAMQSASVDIQQLRHEILSTQTAGSECSNPEIRFSPEVQEALKHAWCHALDHKSVVTKECILLGLLQQENGLIRRILQKVSKDHQPIRKSLVQSLMGWQQA